ncbi:MAG: hypothetical protein DID92_2727744824 [Candidatus Nitrotoga sp. SPKER]|nr:MAG: hypothetical protein DID92_2727744824 [Candidatus Nitrotoga sp. SPKER]
MTYAWNVVKNRPRRPVLLEFFNEHRSALDLHCFTTCQIDAKANNDGSINSQARH